MILFDGIFLFVSAPASSRPAAGRRASLARHKSQALLEEEDEGIHSHQKHFGLTQLFTGSQAEHDISPDNAPAGSSLVTSSPDAQIWREETLVSRYVSKD